MIRYGVTLVFPFVIRTILIKRLGTEYAGLGSLFSSILQVLNLSELGFSSAVVFSLYKPVAEKNDELISMIMELFKRIYRIIGIVIAIAGVLICPFVRFLVSGTYPSDVNLNLIFLLYLFNTSVSYIFFGYKSAIIVANQRSDIESKIQIISNLVAYFMELVVLVFIRNYYLYVFSIILGTIVNNCLLLYASNKYFSYSVTEKKLGIAQRREFYKTVGTLVGHKLDGVIINSADSIVISVFLGLNILTIYNNYYFILNAVLSAIILIANSFAASMGNSIVMRSVDINYRNFVSFEYLIGNLNIICSVALLTFYQDFMRLWMGRDLTLETHSIVLMVVLLYVRQMRRAVLVYKDANGMWKGDMLKPYISASVNLMLNIILVRLIGIDGVIISTILSMLIIEFPWEGRVLFNGYFKKSLLPYLVTQIKLVLEGLLVALISQLIFSNVECGTWIGFILKLSVGLILIISITLLLSCIDTDNRNTIKMTFRNIAKVKERIDE